MTKSKIRGTPVLAALLAVAGANATECDPGSAGQMSQAQQKIRLLERLTQNSEPLQRLQNNGDEAALAVVDNAVAIMASAQQALADGCSTDAASLANEALRLVTEAFRSTSAPSGPSLDEFKDELQRVRSFLESLEGRPDSETGLDASALAGIERQLQKAESVAASGSVAEARQLLLPVSDRLQRRVVEMFDQRTIYYENEFASPAEEFAYLEQQVDGYMLLLTSNDKATPYSARQRVADMLDKAGRVRAQARSHEIAGELEDAIEKMNEAVGYCEQAMRAKGYAF